MDLLGELSAASLISKIAGGNAEAATAPELIEAVTATAADCVARSDLGRIEPGAKADLTVVDLSHPMFYPFADPRRGLIALANRADIAQVIVDGRVLVDGGRLLGGDEARNLCCRSGGHRKDLGFARGSPSIAALMPDIDIGGGVLHYEEQGAGEPVFLVSGLNGLAAPWQAVATMLARRFRVVTHDHLGLGGSGAQSGSCSVDAIAADVLALMDRLTVSRAHLVGHFLGGAVVQAIAADHPERVARLVVYASWPGYDSYFDRVMSAPPGGIDWDGNRPLPPNGDQSEFIPLAGSATTTRPFVACFRISWLSSWEEM